MLTIPVTAQPPHASSGLMGRPFIVRRFCATNITITNVTGVAIPAATDAQ